MPYIKEELRDQIDNVPIADFVPSNAGELQYAIARMIHSYMEAKGISYQRCNDVMGALTGANLEFYRVVVAPYEEQKIKLNGLVYSSIYRKEV